MDVVDHELALGYEHWSAEHVLRRILPPELEIPSSFETIGHIAHLNLREEHMLYKKIIGEVILDKNPKLKTVVNKVGTIENAFRVPEFEILAGENKMVTEVKQYGAIFHLDYGLVYWNSRLEHEHKRLVAQFRAGEAIVDIFSGIGPFAIPAAQKGCLVYANDLNPESVKYLVKNAEINKVSRRIAAYNMDARHFLKRLTSPPVANPTEDTADKTEEKSTGRHVNESSEIGDTMKKDLDFSRRPPTKGKKNVASFPEMADSKPWEHFDHVVMNLPASALEFLDTFKGLLSRSVWRGSMPRIHCYCFMKSKETESDIIEKAEAYIGGSLPANTSVWTVRNVAPNKTMLCISFILPEFIAFGETSYSPGTDLEPETTSGTKRHRTL